MIMRVSGTLFNYYQVCKRELWLHANGINMEHNSELVAEGKFVHEESYPKRSEKYEEVEITELQLKQLEASAQDFMNPDEDSIIIFSSRAQMFMDKRIIGAERNSIDHFL